MKESVKKTIILILSTLLFLTSCVTNQEKIDSNNSTDLDIITNTINYLTSDDCYGRLPGTEGNILAQNYIVEEFKNIGLEPYADSFLLPYTKKSISIIEENVALELYNTGEVIEFDYGQDFVEVEISDFTIELPIYDKVKDEECILLVENIKEAQEYKNNEKVKACLALQNDLKRSIPIPEISGHSIPFKINQYTYDTLKDNLGQTVRLAMNIEEKEIKQNNVVAKITGENNEQALVITAHFDHVGGINDIIYRGALDNASGVASLLNIAQHLNEVYKVDKPPIDIIFAAVNSEETLISKYGCGSAKLAQDVQDKNYSIFNINLDCIGSIDYNPISIDINRNELSNAQGENIAKYFTENDLEAKIAEGICFSDQKSFEYGLAITTLSDNSIIHSVKDTKEQIDINYINQISDLISTYIIKNISDFIVPQNINDDIYTIIRKEEDSLDLGEYKFIEINGENHLVLNASIHGKTIKELENIYQHDMSFIPRDIGNYELNIVSVMANRLRQYEPQIDQHEIDKVYRLDNKISDIYAVDLLYNRFLRLSFRIINKSNSIKVRDQLIPETQFYHEEYSKEQKIEADGITYYFKELEDIGKSIITGFETDNLVVYANLYGEIIKDKDNQEIITFLKENNLGNIIQETVKFFDNNNKKESDI